MFKNKPACFNHEPVDVTVIKGFHDNKITGISRYEDALIALLAREFSLRVVPVDSLTKHSHLMRLFYFLLNASGMGRLFSIKNGAIVHFMCQQAALSLNFMPLSNKIVVTVFDIFPFLTLYRSSMSLASRLRYHLVSRGIRLAARIVTISNYTKGQISENLGINPDKITVAYEAVEHKQYHTIKEAAYDVRKKYLIPQDCRIVLCVGSEEPRKNIPSLLKAFARLRERIGNVVLIKVGDAQYAGARENNLLLVKELGLEKDVIFTGYAEEEDLVLLYNSADVFVLPTLDEGGFALPILEAMACGCPVITSRIPVLQETVADAGIFVEPYDIAALEERMYEVIHDPQLRRDLIRKGLERARQFTWEKTAEVVIKVYKELLR